LPGLPNKSSAAGDPQAASANVRLRWNYRPDTDLFIIYTASQRFASLVAASPAQILRKSVRHHMHLPMATMKSR
jgi:hypothetical protein